MSIIWYTWKDEHRNLWTTVYLTLRLSCLLLVLSPKLSPHSPHPPPQTLKPYHITTLRCRRLQLNARQAGLPWAVRPPATHARAARTPPSAVPRSAPRAPPDTPALTCRQTRWPAPPGPSASSVTPYALTAQRGRTAARGHRSACPVPWGTRVWTRRRRRRFAAKGTTQTGDRWATSLLQAVIERCSVRSESLSPCIFSLLLYLMLLENCMVCPCDVAGDHGPRHVVVG